MLGENTEKYISFSVSIKKKHDNDKTVTYKYTKYSLFIHVDSCQVNYQVFLITCLKLTIRIAKHAWREKRSSQNMILLGLKIIDWITDVNNAMEYLLSQ